MAWWKTLTRKQVDAIVRRFSDADIMYAYMHVRGTAEAIVWVAAVIREGNRREIL